MKESTPDPEAGAGAARRPGRPRSTAKRSAILDQAGRLFLSCGPDGTSMDAVADAAGVSKQTVYSHFGNKENLFAACIENKVRSYRLGGDALDLDLPVRDALLQVGGRFAALLMDPEVIAMNRLVISVSPVHPEIAELFERTGPGPALAGLARLLQHYGRAGEIALDDPVEAAELFAAMLRGDQQRRLLMGLGHPPAEVDREAHVRRTVDRFLRLHAPASAG